MRNRLIYILKHNIVLQRIYVCLFSLFLKFVGCFIKTDDNLVLFVSFMGKSFNDSPREIYEYMMQHTEYKAYRCIWAFEEPQAFPELETVKIDSPQYFMLALKAKYWVTNTNIERGLHFKKSTTKYLNTWHGIALKHIGNDCPGRNDYDFSNIDYLVVSGKHDELVFKSAFRAKENSYLRCGMPRNELLWHVDRTKRDIIRNKIGLPDDKKIILYAPTWRESVDGGKTYSIKPPVNLEKWREVLSDDYVILFRAHHQTSKVLGIPYDDFVRNVSEYPNVNDLMIVADILITDYSAIAFDFSILGKPILCYAYDYDTYLLDRGTYFDIDEQYPNKSCRNEDDLLKRIKNMDYSAECDNTIRFRDSFIQYKGCSTELCVKKLFDK